jgi:galactokinase
MTGAGFGGCAMALVQADCVDAFAARMVECYSTTTGIAPNVYHCAAAGGAEVLSGGLEW